MSMDKIDEHFYDPKTTMRVLGIDRSKLSYWVRVGLLERVTLGGKLKHGMYRRKQVDDLAKRLEAVILALDSGTEVFRRATLDDLQAENELALINFGSGPSTSANNLARRAFLQKNPEMFYHLYDNNILVAAINIVPLKEHCIAEFREGKRGWLFSPDDIEQFEPGHPLHLIIINFMTTPSVPPVRRSGYAVRLLSELATVLETWGAAGVEIADIHASGGTPAGRRILESAGFTLLGQKTTTRVIYFLALTSSDLKLLSGYKAALAGYKAAHSGSV